MLLTAAALIGELSSAHVGYVFVCTSGAVVYTGVTFAVCLLHAAEAAASAPVSFRRGIEKVAAPLLIAVLTVPPAAAATVLFVSESECEAWSLATGGAGFIGSHTCVELLRNGYEVVVVDDHSNSSPGALDEVQKLAVDHLVPVPQCTSAAAAGYRGLGFGGCCLSKDIRAFIVRASELGVGQALGFLKEVDEINVRRRERVVEMARQLVGGSFLGRNVAVLGAAFKPDSDDVRDSPALSVATAIQQRGGRVRVHDPEALDNARASHPGLDYAREVSKACERADIVLHLTDWKQYRELDPAALAETVSHARILDGRNVLPTDSWRAAGWTVRGLGRAGCLNCSTALSGGGTEDADLRA
ncbi:UDP binding domain-containing protein [Nocardia uniformis]|uniref:UDP binding domain-containing protein n=1 Tax=Nocardia uniformis TaxID=53432 RepID=UPI001BB1AF53|nr:UDP binding domain-containing protein [Nocardia uniformis]